MKPDEGELLLDDDSLTGLPSVLLELGPVDRGTEGDGAVVSEIDDIEEVPVLSGTEEVS